MKIHTILVLTFVSLSLFGNPANAHCQVPCGIYDDHARLRAMLEDARTVKKAFRMIHELSGRHDAQSVQQLIRWVKNKESHAQKIITTVCDYYLTQRVKPEQKDYVERLQEHHAVIVAAMKAKQNTEVRYASELVEVIEALIEYYPDR